VGLYGESEKKKEKKENIYHLSLYLFIHSPIFNLFIFYLNISLKSPVGT